jgi:hypothetical protein
MNAQQLSPLVEAQALVIAGLEARIEVLEARLGGSPDGPVVQQQCRG